MAEVEIDRMSGKIIGLAAIGILAALLLGYEFRLWFNEPTTSEFVALLIFAFVWLITALLTVFFVKGSRVAAMFGLLEVIALWVSLEHKFASFTLLGIACLFFGYLIGFSRGRTDLANSIKIRFTHTSYRAMPAITTGLVLFFTLYLLGALNPTAAVFHKSALEFLFRSTEPITSKMLPGFSSDQSVDEVLKLVVASRLPSGSTSGEITHDVEQFKAAIEKGTDVKLLGNERFTDALYSLTVARFNSLAPVYRTLTMISLGLIVFGIVKGFAFFGNMLVIGLAFLAFELLSAFGFMRISNDSIMREMIVVD